MTAILEDTSPPAMAPAIEANAAAQYALLARLLDAEMDDGPAALWYITGIDFSLFNGVMRARFAPDTADACTDALLARFAARAVPMVWHVGPHSLPGDLGERLQARGFFASDGSPGMAVALETLARRPLPRGLTIAPVTDEHEFAHWLRVLDIGFGLRELARDTIAQAIRRDGFGPEAGMRHYLGRLDGEPIATCTLFPGAGVAGIYNVSTLPAGRRLGIGAAITLLPLLDARAAGYRVGILQSTPMGYGVYRRLGFRRLATLTQYTWRPGMSAVT